MYIPKYLLNCDIIGVLFSDGFCVGYLKRFISCVSIKDCN